MRRWRFEPSSTKAVVNVRKRVVISGRVQGVFFRDHCYRLASAEGVAGRVRNLASGEVEACFEGEPHAVGRMVDWCRHGPPQAVVTEVRVVDEQPKGERRFVIGWG